MWKIISRLFGLYNPVAVDDNAEVLHDKILVLLYRASSLTHFQVTKKMIKEYANLMKNRGYPLDMVEKYNNIVILWNQRYKLWKRG